MNILLVSNHKPLAFAVANVVAKKFNYVVKDYDEARQGTQTAIVEHWIVIGAPSDVKEYRKLSASGYNPDLVFFIKSTSTNTHDTSDSLHAILNRFYDNIITFSSNSQMWLSEKVEKAVKEELLQKSLKVYG